MQHRQLDFRTGEEVLAEIDRLERVGYDRGKNWNLTQICEHLERTMRMGLKDSPFRFPWILRTTVKNTPS
jgi:hypothetical protein